MTLGPASSTQRMPPAPGSQTPTSRRPDRLASGAQRHLGSQVRYTHWWQPKRTPNLKRTAPLASAGRRTRKGCVLLLLFAVRPGGLTTNSSRRRAKSPTPGSIRSPVRVRGSAGGAAILATTRVPGLLGRDLPDRRQHLLRRSGRAGDQALPVRLSEPESVVNGAEQ